MRAKKHLGQHFLNSSVYLRAIADAAEVKGKDVVVEVGPGQGSLTAELLSRGAHVIAIEKDHALITLLQEKFAKEIFNKQLELIVGDILSFDIAGIGLREGSYKLVANIPYYITGAIFEKFLGSAPRPFTAALLVQKEVAERIARSTKESILSLSVKVYGVPKYIKTVPAGAFTPMPQVDSAILLISNISTKNFTNEGHEKWFFELLKAGFAHKRKLLRRNLESCLKENTEKMLAHAAIPTTARAEDVPLQKWLLLSEDLE